MKTLVLVLVSLLTVVPSFAGTIFVQATVTSSLVGPQSLDDFESATHSYVLNVIGGTETGSGFATLEFLLQGSFIATSSGCDFIGGQPVCAEGLAGVSSPINIGEPFGPGDNGSPTLSCAVVGYVCQIPFVFNQPEVITITAWAEARLYSQEACLSCGTVFASVEFDGVGPITDANGTLLPGVQYTFNSVDSMPSDSTAPEPNTALSVGAGALLVIGACRKRRESFPTCPLA